MNQHDNFEDLMKKIDAEKAKENPAAAPKNPRVSSPSGAPGPGEQVDSANQEPELPDWLTSKKARTNPNRAPESGAAPSPRPPAEKPAGAASRERAQSTAPELPQKQDFMVDLSRYSEPEVKEKTVSQPAPASSAPTRREPGSAKKEKPVIRKKYRVGRALLITLLCLGISVYLAFFGIRSFEDLTGVLLFGGSEIERPLSVVIPEGASLSEISKILKESGVITEPFTFRLYAQIKNRTDFKSGEYIMTDKMDYNAIIYALRMGDERTDVVEIMFPEGSTVVDIAKKLEEKGVCSAASFYEAVNGGTYNYSFVDNLPQNALRFYKLEGYLFPNTHQFFVGENAESVINRFLRDFNSKITDEMRTKMNELNLTLDQTIVLASLIQMEASDPYEMRNVSEVFHNRLRNTDIYSQLQSDPTIFYVERVIKRNITNTNQAMYDAYNTYVCEGLPVGAICNPGMDAIEAALNPAKHDEVYYFFVTDNAGKYYYAETDQQHEINKAEAARVNKELAAQSSASSTTTN